MSATINERPILFSGAMVRAILEGRKGQTRRSFSDRWLKFFAAAARAGEISDFITHGFLAPNDEAYLLEHCPFGKPGDRLWVRETWGEEFSAQVKDALGRKDADDLQIFYGADKCGWGGPWFPSIHMYRWASRLLLEVVSVRVERLKEISEADAIAEGIERSAAEFKNYDRKDAQIFPWLGGVNAARLSYESLWNSISGPASWDENPWVWVVEFKRIPESGMTKGGEA